jgi:hypothetical protein
VKNYLQGGRGTDLEENGSRSTIVGGGEGGGGGGRPIERERAEGERGGRISHRFKFPPVAPTALA